MYLLIFSTRQTNLTLEENAKKNIQQPVQPVISLRYVRSIS